MRTVEEASRRVLLRESNMCVLFDVVGCISSGSVSFASTHQRPSVPCD